MIPEDWLRVVQALGQQEPTIAAIWLFGSYARGEQTDDSDVDLAVELDSPDGDDITEWSRCSARWRQHLAILPKKVDLQHCREGNKVVRPGMEPKILLYRAAPRRVART